MRLSDVIYFLAAKKRHWRLTRLLDRVAYNFHRVHEAVGYDFDTNGEARVFEALKGQNVKCIFDVGANVGDWALLALDAFPESEVHCFEAAAPTFESLARNVAGNPRVRLNPFGLGAAEGSAVLKYAPGDDRLTSAVEVVGTRDLVSLTARIRAGDDYVRENGVERVDFLKIDVEGMEGQVLAGFGRTLSEQRVRVVQFEYGQVNAFSRFLLRDFYELFDGYGYLVGKIYPHRVDFRRYDYIHEDFIGPNYLAVRRGEGGLIESLAGH